MYRYRREGRTGCNHDRLYFFRGNQLLLTLDLDLEHLTGTVDVSAEAVDYELHALSCRGYGNKCIRCLFDWRRDIEPSGSIDFLSTL